MRHGGETPPCSGCGAEARVPGQRYGRECRNEANRKYRARRKALIGRLRQELQTGEREFVRLSHD